MVLIEMIRKVKIEAFTHVIPPKYKEALLLTFDLTYLEPGDIIISSSVEWWIR